MIQRKSKLKKILTRTNSISAIKGTRKTSILLKQYKSSTANKVSGQQLLAAFALESRSKTNALASGPASERKSQRRKKRERYEAAVRSCQLDHSDILLVLLRQHNVDPERASSKTGFTLLIISTQFGHMDCVLALLAQRGVNIDKIDRWGWSPLHWAAKDPERVRILQQLLRKKAKKNQRDGMYGRTPFEICCENGNEVGAIALLEQQCKVRYKVPPPKGFGLNFELPKWAFAKSPFNSLAVFLLIISQEGAVVKVKKLLDYIDNETFKRSNETEACKERHKQAGRGGIIDYRATPHGETCLMRAAANGHAGVLNVILLRSCIIRKYINAESPRCGSALGLACSAGSIDSVKVLIRYGAFINREEIHTGLTPIMTAAKSIDNANLLIALLERKAEMDQQDTKDGLSAIMISAWCGHSENVLELLERGADLTLASNNGVTPLMMCCAKQMKDCVKRMIDQHRTNVTSSEEEEEDDYDDYSDNGKPTSTLTFTYQLINATDEDGWNSLRWACEGDARDVVMLLLDTKKITIDAAAFAVDASGAWIDPPWIKPYVDCVRIKVEENLRENGLDRWIGSVPIDRLLVASRGDFNAAMRLSVVQAHEAIVRHEKMEKRMHRQLLKAEVHVERKNRARGGKNWNLQGEVSSLLDRGATRASTTSVNDLAFMMLPSLEMNAPPKVCEGEVWNV